MKAPVNRIIPFSNVDGPGNRCSIFFQSCPFHCAYCHNPETIHMCTHCGTCVEKCLVQALTIEAGKVVWHREKCVECDTCIHICPHSASPKIRNMEVGELIDEIKDDFPFIQGITVSGGECMVHADFLLELFKKVKKYNKTCLIDSNGYFDFEKYPELLEICDGVMLDMKAFDEDFHQKVTGQSNQMVLKNLTTLLEKEKLEEVRTVLLPNEPEQNEKTVSSVNQLLQGKVRYKLLRYRPFGVNEKGLQFCGRTITPLEEAERLAKAEKEKGYNNVVII